MWAQKIFSQLQTWKGAIEITLLENGFFDVRLRDMELGKTREIVQGNVDTGKVFYSGMGTLEKVNRDD